MKPTEALAALEAHLEATRGRTKKHNPQVDRAIAKLFSEGALEEPDVRGIGVWSLRKLIRESRKALKSTGRGLLCIATKTWVVTNWNAAPQTKG